MQDYWKSADRSHVVNYETSAAKLPLGSATTLIEQSGILNVATPVNVLDNACGTGVVSHYLMSVLTEEQKAFVSLTMADLNEQMVKAAEGKASQLGCKEVVAKVVDMQNMEDFADASFDFILVNQGIQFAPDASKTLQEHSRILKPGGVLAFATWESVSWPVVVQKACEGIPGCPVFPDGAEAFQLLTHGNAWHKKDFIEAELPKYGLRLASLETAPKQHALTKEAFTNTFAGPMLRGMLPTFWGKEKAEEFFGRIAPAVSEYIAATTGEGVQVDMIALVAVARKL